jgi:hypothetical protein
MPILVSVAPEGPVAGIVLLLLYAIPIVVIFASGILTLWGTALIHLGLKERESVLALVLTTMVSALPVLLFLLVWMSV